MKKLIPSIMVACLLSLFVSGSLNAEIKASRSFDNAAGASVLANANALGATNRPQVVTPFEKTETERTAVLVGRVYDIKAMDVSALNAADRKALRKELRCIKSELTAINAASLSQTGGGVYLSVGAIIVIVLLILLL